MAKKKEEKPLSVVVVIKDSKVRQDPNDYSAVVIDVSSGTKLEPGNGKNTKDYISVKIPIKVFGNQLTGYIKKDCVEIKEVN